MITAAPRAAPCAPRPIDDYFPVVGYLETFIRHLREDPERAACYAVTAGGGRLDARAVSFRALAERAGRLRQAFERRGLAPGDRILACVSQPDHMLAVLLACMAGGCVAVPLPTIGDFALPDVFLNRVRAVAQDCTPRLMLVESLPAWERIRADSGLDVAAAHPDDLTGEGSAGPLPEHPHGEVAFIQYTSGSTGKPRGVMVTHGNLAANVKAIGAATGVRPNDRTVTWLPLHHDMGLVGGLLFPVYHRMPTYVMAPLSFVARPVSWLRAIARFRATYSVAPNFAYCLCARTIPERDLRDLDLSSWRLAFNGAEPIDARMMRRFIDRFAPYGFRGSSYYPVYGLAEATLAVAFPTAGADPVVDAIDRRVLAAQGAAAPVPPDAPHALTFVSVGHAMPGHTVRIEDPQSRRPLPEREVGEIVTAGPSISPRYFGRDEPPRTELRTGDLGYFADGYLYVIDRLKDLIIIAGQNFSPSDLEACAAVVPGVRAGRAVAFATAGDMGTERLHVVAELNPRSLRRQEAIVAEVTACLQARFGLAPFDVTLVEPGRLPRTTSGKLQRAACRALYAAGELRGTLSLGARARMHARWLTRWTYLLNWRAPRG